MPLQRVLARLDGVRRRNGYWEAKCPAHEDRHASLSVSQGEDGRVLLNCFAGCSYGEIMGAVGLSGSDGFVDREEEAPDIVYQYTDEHGALLFEVCRFPGKRFRQRSADGTWSMRGVRRVLYRLPELIEAVGKRRIFICEGEKDVEAIRAAGGVGTCNPMGAGKWSTEYDDVFQGAHVYIVVDDDDTGRRHSQAIFDSLHGKAAMVELVSPAAGKDAHDHLEAGFGLDEFLPYEVQTGLILKSAASVKPEDVEWVEGFENMIAYGVLTSLVGMPGTNKTTWTMLPVSTVSQSHGVLIVSAEDAPNVLRGRLQAVQAKLPNCFFGSMRRDGLDGGLILVPDDIAELAKTIEKRKIRLLILDPIQAHYGRGIDSYKDQSVRSALAPLASIASRNQCAILMLYHLTKGFSRDPIIRAGGSVGVPGISRTCLLMALHPNDQDKRVIVGFKNNFGPKRAAIEYRVEMVATEGFKVPPIRLSWFQESYWTPAQLLGGGENQ